VTGRLTAAVLAHADEPDLAGTLDCLIEECRAIDGGVELLVVINAATRLPSPALLSAMRLFSLRGVRARVEELERRHMPLPAAGLAARVVESSRKGKAWAWNRAWEKASGEVRIFCDADIRIARGSLARLCETLERRADIDAASATPVAVTAQASSFTARASALRYRFDLGSLFGGLYALRGSASVYPMPEDLLTEDAWLTARIGREKIVRVAEAQAFFLPAATLRDYFWERVRTEAGKLQLAALLGARGGRARSSYPWRAFARDFTGNDYLLAGFTAAVRALANLWARVEMRNGDPQRLWRLLPTTKARAKATEGRGGPSLPERPHAGRVG